MIVTPTSAPHRQFVGLDLLRFIAATIVMFYHLTFCAWAVPGAPARFGQFADFGLRNFGTSFDFGWVGVEIFFVISGFVIAFSAEKATAQRFARSRLLRLLPAMWLSTIIITAIILASHEGSLGGILFRFASSVFFQPFGPWVSGVYWTLQAEAVFYFLVFLLLRYSSFAHIERLAMWIGFLSLAFWSLYSLLQIYPIAPFDNLILRAARHQIFAFLLVRYGSFFAVGILLWATFARGWSLRRSALLLVYFATSIGEIIHYAGATAEYMKAPLHFVAPVAFWTSAVVAIYASAVWSTPGKELGRFSRSARLLGLMTFPLYLLHEKLGVFVMQTSSAIHLQAVLGFVQSIAVPLFASFWIAAYAEPRIKLWLGRLLDKSPITANIPRLVKAQ